jgi:hypothetical protein
VAYYTFLCAPTYSEPDPYLDTNSYNPVSILGCIIAILLARGLIELVLI